MVFPSLVFLALSAFAQEESTLQKLEKEIHAVAEKVRPSVVQVQADLRIFTGVVYDEKGHVVTDASGTDRAAEIRVTIGQRVYSAERVDADRRTGVAVLKVDAKELKPASFSEESTKSGATAVLVGYPEGMPGSVRWGTIGGLGRSIRVNGRKFENMLQLSIVVHPGDCGGFVADSSGRCVGLIHAGGREEAGDEKLLPALAFAVPAPWVKFSADRIIKHGRIVRGWLGASLQPLAEAARSHLGLEAGVGAEVTRVEPKSPADRAGLAGHDILISFDGQPVADLESLQWKIARYEAPAKVKLAFLRNRERQDVETQIELDPQK